MEKMHIVRLLLSSFCFFCFMLAPLRAAESPSAKEELYTINFREVQIVEFIQFVSKISKVNFLFNHNDLQFNVSLAAGKPMSADQILKALVQMLKVRGFVVMEQDQHFVIHRAGDVSSKTENGTISLADYVNAGGGSGKSEFFVYKLQYHQGSEIQEAIKQIAADLKTHSDTSPKLISAIHSMQWVKSTNSLLCSGDEETLASLKKLISSLDIPLRQVFIEVLVVETEVHKGLEFGLQWAAGGQFKERFGAGAGNFPPGRTPSHFANTMQGINASNTPTGLNQVPIGNAFDLGVIGDLIMHKGASYLSLGALVSALQADGDTTIVLNQKIITQDNKNSKIFVGDNIPFTGSIVQTVGQSQQTTANIEYRDIGVSLSITPMLGEGDIVTLDLDEEISETVNNPMNPIPNDGVNGIRTTKTNMVTHVHVPDKHFLVLSGMIRNSRSNHKAGLPCLGGLPGIGAAFSKTRRHDEKRNVIVFVCPHIIRSFEDYKKLTEKQESLYEANSAPAEFRGALQLAQ